MPPAVSAVAKKSMRSLPQVGDRRYARGRAYDPNRFSTAAAPDEAEPLPVEAVEEPVAEPVAEPAAETAPQAENLD